MKDQTENKLVGATSTNLPIDGRNFNIYFREGDSYLAQESLNVRAAEISTFKNTCVNLLGQIDTHSATCVLDVGANVGVTSLVLGVLAQGGKLSTVSVLDLCLL